MRIRNFENLRCYIWNFVVITAYLVSHGGLFGNNNVVERASSLEQKGGSWGVGNEACASHALLGKFEFLFDLTLPGNFEIQNG